MRKSGVYKIESRVRPDRIYIGSSCNIYRRWAGHLSELRRGIHHSKKLQRHYDKYGESDLLFSILLSCDRDHIIDIEQYFLDSYVTYFNNLLIARPVKYIPHKEETKEKMRRSRMGRKLSEETKQKISRSHIGMRPTEETRKKLRESHLGQKSPRTPEWCENISKGLKGRTFSEETRKKMSDAKKGKSPWNKGLKKIVTEPCQN